MCKHILVSANKARTPTTNKSMAGENTIMSGSSHQRDFRFCGAVLIARSQPNEMPLAARDKKFHTPFILGVGSSGGSANFGSELFPHNNEQDD